MNWNDLYEMPSKEKQALSEKMFKEIDSFSIEELCDLAFIGFRSPNIDSIIERIFEYSGAETVTEKSKKQYVMALISKRDGDENKATLLFKDILATGTAEVKPYAALAQATSFLTNGKIHIGLKLLNDLILDTQTPELIRDLARIDLAVFKLELCQFDSLDIPKSDQSEILVIRREMLKEFVNGNVFIASEQLKHNSTLHNDYKNNKFNLLILSDLIIGYSILNQDAFLEDVKKSWLEDCLVKLKGTAFYSRLLAVAGIVPYEESQNYTKSWLSKSREYMFDIILQISNGRSTDANNTLNNKLSPMLRDIRIFSVTTPYRLYDSWVPETAISLALEKKLDLSERPVSQSEQVIIENNILTFFNGQSTVTKDISKWSSSLTMLLILAGPKGSFSTNANIHNVLYTDTYEHSIHSKRIYKNITRLKNSLENAGIPDLWHRPGDGKIVNNFDIIIR